MNWNKILLTGVAGGVVLWLYNFVMHGLIMGSTYKGMAIFRQDGSPLPFLFVEIFIGIAGAALFSKTRSVWGEGVKGGMTFGLFVGLIAFFAQFIQPLVMTNFPYYMAWCWGGIVLLGWMVFGAVASMTYKTTA